MSDFKRNSCGFLVSLICVLFSNTAIGTSAISISALQIQAEERQLHQERTWQLLLHFEPESGHSRLEGEYFFLSEVGHTDPAAELKATLLAFAKNQYVEQRKEHARCVFPARYRWLKSQLTFSDQDFPQPNCDRYQTWLGGLKPERAYIVFPDAYPNGPSSMFGHTLIRVDGSGQEGLLAYAINYAADAEADNALFYGVKGLVGGYPGSFGIFPYYKKVQEYAHAENRDIWEYPLLLQPEALKQLLAHIWELRGASFPYLFLSRNCSYELLVLLELVRPDLRLQEQFFSHTIPADTIRAMAAEEGLLGKPRFRPSTGRVLSDQISQLSSEAQDCLYGLAMGELDVEADCLRQQPVKQQAQILEAAQKFLYYGLKSGRFQRSQIAQRSINLLAARSQLDPVDVFSAVQQPTVAPEHGHGTFRVAVGLATENQRSERSTSWTLRVRPAFHDQLDSSEGYTAGAQINFLDARFRYTPERSSIRLDELKVIDIISLSSRNRFFQPVAWRVGTGFRRNPLVSKMTTHQSHLGAYVQGGAGFAWGDIKHFAGYGLALGSLDVNTAMDKEHRFALGGALGLRTESLGNWNGLLEVGQLSGIWGQQGRQRWLTAGLQAHLDRQWGLRFEVSSQQFGEQSWGQIEVGLHHYF